MANCMGCEQNWPLGKYGCHYEPILSDDEDSVGRKVSCSNWAERRKAFYGESIIAEHMS